MKVSFRGFLLQHNCRTNYEFVKTDELEHSGENNRLDIGKITSKRIT